MKKRTNIIMAIGAALPIATYGASMCVPTNVYYGVLIPEHAAIEPTTTDGLNWTATMDYVVAAYGGTTYNVVKGFASCNEITGTTDSIAGNVSAAPEVSGPNCWCGLTRPLTQKFAVFTGQTYTTNADCESNCAALCVTKIKAASNTFRTALYDGVNKF